ncbi:MAG: hypothetical protein J7K87_00735 [Candidatus Aenigmarchaeota archaeon]|nr:hypothetical protein [Candidatus Aenigmarchaeota archaeon]
MKDYVDFGGITGNGINQIEGEDVPIIAKYFGKLFSREYSKPPRDKVKKEDSQLSSDLTYSPLGPVNNDTYFDEDCTGENLMRDVYESKGEIKVERDKNMKANKMVAYVKIGTFGKKPIAESWDQGESWELLQTTNKKLIEHAQGLIGLKLALKYKTPEPITIEDEQGFYS